MGFSAADVERYTYCPMSWALARGGISASEEMAARGNLAHDQVGLKISRWRRFLEEHNESLQTALYLALVAASAATLAIEITFLDFTGLFNRVLMIMSLTWLLVALGFLLHAMRKEQEARSFVTANGLVAGELAYSDLDRPAETLRSEKYELSGRPDYIVRRGSTFIPVELKTGRTPDHPHESHLMQLGVYCLLVEERYQTRPGMGVLQYPDRAFEVPWTDEFRDHVLETVLRMKLAEVTGNVRRNHVRIGKCRGCSRRESCAERLT